MHDESRTPSMANKSTDLIDILYRQVLKRDADVGGRRVWIELLRRRKHTVHDVVQGMALSDEYARQMAGLSPTGVIGECYRRLLGREPDPAGEAHWVRILRSDGLPAAVQGMIGSPEYLKQFGATGVPGHPELHGVLWSAPVVHRREDDFGAFRMSTLVTVSPDGRVQASTRIENRVPLCGTCGTVGLWFFDEDEKVLETLGAHRYHVDGTQIPAGGVSCRSENWEGQLSRDTTEAVFSLAIVHAPCTQNVVARAMAERAVSRAERLFTHR